MAKLSDTLLPRRDFIKYASVGAVVIGSLPTLAFASDRIAKTNGTAIKSYDTTVYFRLGTPQKESTSTVVEWKGAEWRLATAADTTTFRANPERYSPKFGGFCTRAMSKGIVVKGNPEVWRIHDQQLYLFARPLGQAGLEQRASNRNHNGSKGV